MRLIFLYGPPAAGKMTVGKELAKLTGYRFLYNHLTVPAAKALFPDAHGPVYDTHYTQLLHTLRIDALTIAAEAGLDVIFTLAYSGAVDHEFVTRIVDTFESRGGSVHFVELHASPEVLKQRVGNTDRIALNMGKVTDPDHLENILEGRDVFASVPYDPILKIDTTTTSAADAAAMIKARYCN